MRDDKYIVPIVSSFDAAPLYQDLVAAITTLFTVYTEVQIKFTFCNKNKNAFNPGWTGGGSGSVVVQAVVVCLRSCLKATVAALLPIHK